MSIPTIEPTRAKPAAIREQNAIPMMIRTPARMLLRKKQLPDATEGGVQDRHRVGAPRASAVSRNENPHARPVDGRQRGLHQRTESPKRDLQRRNEKQQGGDVEGQRERGTPHAPPNTAASVAWTRVTLRVSNPHGRAQTPVPAAGSSSAAVSSAAGSSATGSDPATTSVMSCSPPFHDHSVLSQYPSRNRIATGSPRSIPPSIPTPSDGRSGPVQRAAPATRTFPDEATKQRSRTS